MRDENRLRKFRHQKRYFNIPGSGQRPVPSVTMILLVLALCTGCSFRQMAVSKLGDALSTGGTAYATDDDPELIKGAIPFSLKLIESLLAESPRHERLLLAACRGFTQYTHQLITGRTSRSSRLQTAVDLTF